MAAGLAVAAAAVTPSALALVSLPGPPVVPPSSAPPRPIGTLNDAHPFLDFTGPILNPTPAPLVNPPIPAVCVQATCQEYTVNVASADPFLVAVKNTIVGPNGEFNPNDGLDLYVYGPSGSLLASANGIGANGQSVEIDKKAAGLYTLVVTFAYLEDQNASYTGEVRSMKPSNNWSPDRCTETVVNGVAGCYELPQLQVLPPYDLTVSGVPPVASTPLGFPIPDPVAMPTSCYLDETLPVGNPSVSGVQQPTLRCLRFTSDVQNVGGGTLQIRIPLVNAGSSGVASAYLPGECFAEQVVTTSSDNPVIRPAGSCLFHTQHLHFHYSDLLGYTLYGVKPNAVTPSDGIGQKVGTSVKASFCLSDDDYFGYRSANHNSQRDFTGQPGCNAPANAGSGGTYIDEGIKPGWGDVYTWDTPGQYIDVTNLPAGTYDLVEETNPTGALIVSGPAQTCALTQLKLTSASVQIVSQTPSITCPS